jgi:hypothetical protein
MSPLLVYMRGIEIDFVCVKIFLQVSSLYGAVKVITLLYKLNVLWKHMMALKMISIYLSNTVSFLYRIHPIHLSSCGYSFFL